jgi:ribonucleotide monophosphatase NagD (HAD superfamily)
MCRALGVPATRTAVVGDDLILEIAMARRLGSPPALVLSGISSEVDVLASRQKPTAVLPDVSSFPELLSPGRTRRADS